LRHCNAYKSPTANHVSPMSSGISPNFQPLTASPQELAGSPALDPAGGSTEAVASPTATDALLASANSAANLVSNPSVNPLSREVDATVEVEMSSLHVRLMRQLQRRCNSTPDPVILWHQAAQQLGAGLELSCCLAYGYGSDSQSLPLLAAYGLASQGCPEASALPLEAHGSVTLALAQLKPLVINQPELLLAAVGVSDIDLGAEPQTALLAPVTYLGAPTGLLLLYRRQSQAWTASEIALLTDIGYFLGAAIAHSRTLQENQALAYKLQKVKEDFLYKHKEIEEAHREAERAYEEAEEASRLKSEFLANTSHELRTPLNGMIGFLKLVIDGMADTEEELQEFVGEAHNSALLLLDIINDILDVAKIEAGKMDLDLSVVQLNELFEDVSKKTRRQALARNLLYEITPPPTHDGVIVYGDYQRLLQVLLNLVGNALKFTHSGSITISSRIIEKPVIVNDEDMPGLVEIRVADTGIGVSLDQQAKLFKSFSQVDGSRTRQYGGTGLGLVISQKLVEAMGGEVHFYSMGEELGSTVTFTVPLYQKPVMKAVVDSDLEESDLGLY
jgi:signal transduction histidine kinase